MATITLYPIGNVSVGHTPNPAGNAYSTINEVSADNDVSYIYDEVNNDSSTKNSTFLIGGGENITRKVYIQGVNFSVNYRKTNGNLTAQLGVSCLINGGSFSNEVTSNPTTSYANYTGSLSPSGLNKKYNSFNDANIQIRLRTNISSSSKNNSYQVRITQLKADITYLPYYNCNAFSVQGISSVNVSSNEVKEGDSVTFTAVVNNGYGFAGWYSDAGCTVLVSNSKSYTKSNISDDCTLYAKAELLYTINAVADENCTVSPTSTMGIIGQSVTFTCTPINAMKEFVGWYSNPGLTTLITRNNPYTFTITNDETIYAKCKNKQTFSLKLGGKWITLSKAYKKEGGAWVELNDYSNLFDTDSNYRKIDV